MTRCFACSLAVVLCGCADPQLDIVLEVPESLRMDIRELKLHVYQPPAGVPFGCDELEFRRVDDNTLRLSEVQEVTLIATDSAPLRDIDRLTPKLLYVEGIGDDQPIAYACVQLAEFSDDVEVVLRLEPAASLEFPAGVELSRYLGDPFQPRLPLRVLDARGAGVPGAVVEWTVAGPGGVSTPARRQADPGGHFDLQPDLPNRPGPIVVEVRVRWALRDPVRFDGFQAPTPRRATLQGLPLGAQVGRFGPNGKMAIGALFGRAGREVDIYDASSFPAMNGGRIVPVEVIPVDNGVTLGMLDYPGDEPDRLVVLSTPDTSVGFTRLDPGGARVQNTSARPQGAGAIRRILNGGACRAGGQATLSVVFEGGVIAAYDQNGALLGSQMGNNQDIDILASGCVGDAAGMLVRAKARAAPFGGTTLLVETQEAMWLGLANSITFSRAIGGPEVMIGTQIELDEFAITRARVSVSSGVIEVSTIGTERVPGVPVINAGLDFDGDQRLDLASLLSLTPEQGRVPDYALWGSVAEEFGGERIAGAITIPEESLCFAVMLAGDFDGDGKDDIVVAEASRLLCGSLEPARVFFYPMGVSGE